MPAFLEKIDILATVKCILYTDTFPPSFLYIRLCLSIWVLSFGWTMGADTWGPMWGLFWAQTGFIAFWWIGGGVLVSHETLVLKCAFETITIQSRYVWWTCSYAAVLMLSWNVMLRLSFLCSFSECIFILSCNASEEGKHFLKHVRLKEKNHF